MQKLLSFLHEHPRIFKPRSRVLVACSGGPDSVALAHGLKRIESAAGLVFEIVHVNHQLRGAASKSDEKFVRQLAKELGWKCHVVRLSIKSLKKGNLEEIARDKRYAALHKVAAQRRSRIIVTAHTLDDQVETVLMNLLRGAGPDGMAGMEPVRRLFGGSVWLCRPFLSVSKKELLGLLDRFGWHYRMDRSNFNQQFLRNWLRRTVLPQLEKRSAGFSERIGSLTTMAQAEKQYWGEEMARLESRLLKRFRGGRLLDLGGLLSYPPAVQRRFLRRALGRDLLTFEAVERLRKWMQAPPTGGRQWQLRKGWVVERLSKSKGSPSTKHFWFKKITPAKELQAA